MSNQTVAEVLASADDSVSLINDINTNGSDSEYIASDLSQEEINEAVKRNVDHLEIILAYTDPDVAGSSDDKSSYTSAITTGKAYISANS
jgi:hypothetical protein|tara:strand:+ start:465 stop:734 length:270 start_codon:yes stop_codon:yes gene_type:complete